MECTKRDKNVLWILFFGVGAFLLLFSPYTTLLNDYYGYDTAIWHVIGKGITQGAIPYKDLFDHKGPVLFFIYAVPHFFTNHRVVMFLLQWISLGFSIRYIYKSARLYVNANRACIGIVFFLFLFCGTIGEGAMSEEWCLPFICVSIYLGLKILLLDNTQEISYKYGFVYGVCFGIIAMIRLNNAAAIGGIVLALSLIQIRKKEYLNVVKNGIAFVMGGALVITPIILWFYSKDALQYLWWGAFEFNLKYAINAPDVRNGWEIVRSWLMAIPIVAYLILCVCAIKNIGKCEDKFLIGLVGIVSVITLMFGGTFFHYYTIILPVHVVLFCIVMKEYSMNSKKMNVMLMGIVLFIMLSFSWQSIRNAGKSVLFAWKDWYGIQHEQIQEFMSQIPENDMNSVWGNGEGFSRVYCVSDIIPCFQYFDNCRIHFSVDSKMEGETWEMLNTNPPRWIVLSELDILPSDRIIKTIEESYILFDTLNGERHLELYRINIE